jgi:DNA-binding transcriptional ArsR family regulator
VRPPHADTTVADAGAPPAAPAHARAPGRTNAGRAARPAAPSGSPHEPRLAHVAALVADATRARMLAYLLSGEYASAGELARAASVGAATASAHLARLVESGLLACEPRGRHRYFRIADADVAHALEALAMVAERSTHERSWSAPARMRLREARCCYGHLAGRRGVALLQRMLARGWLALAPDGYALTPDGAAGLAELGLDATAWLQAPPRRRAAYPCLDWSERRDHLAGPLATSLLSHFVARGWLRREPGERALTLTPPGQLALASLVEPEDENPAAPRGT